MENKKYSIIIPAGGKGERLKYFLNGKNKQFSLLGNKMILEIVIERLIKLIDFNEFVIAFPKDDFENKKEYFLNKFPFLKIIIGGETRQKSVFLALKNLKFFNQVLIHDAVRPFFSEKVLNNLLKLAEYKKNVILAVKLKDTIRKFENGISEKSFDREKIYLVQTPQIFNYFDLINAYEFAEKNNFLATDDGGVLEYFGKKVYLCEGNYENFKITTKFDYILAKILIKKENNFLNNFL